MNNTSRLVYVWSRYIRIFHWLNALAIMLLLGFGLVIFFASTLGISTDGKVILKTLHVIVGYVFAINLLVRIIMGFVGKDYERWCIVIGYDCTNDKRACGCRNRYLLSSIWPVFR